ncbi:hypothetical protein LTR08_005555 [Meristemomyces frigidus]|nr:hypothetical protein LTR08_005555 [Meristemomyces frigidus]
MLHVRSRLRSSHPVRHVTATRSVYRNARPAPTAAPSNTVPSEDGTRTLRQRQHGARSLPLPPLLDPVAIAATERYRGAKPLKAAGGKTEFQRALHMNPYAQALATPVRQCALTTARLPQHFLLPLITTIADPTPPLPTPTTHHLPLLELSSGPPHPTTACLLPDLPTSATTSTSTSNPLRAPARSYVLARLPILRLLAIKTRWVQVVTERMRRWFALKTGKTWQNLRVQNLWAFERDTAERVLDAMRAGVVGMVEAIFEEGKAKAVVVARGCVEMEEMGERGWGGVCMLRVGGVGSAERDCVMFEREMGVALHPAVRIYDLARLLDEEGVRRIMKVGRIDDRGSAAWVMVKKSHQGVELQLALLRLEVYLRPASS